MKKTKILLSFLLLGGVMMTSPVFASTPGVLNPLIQKITEETNKPAEEEKKIVEKIAEKEVLQEINQEATADIQKMNESIVENEKTLKELEEKSKENIALKSQIEAIKKENANYLFDIEKKTKVIQENQKTIEAYTITEAQNRILLEKNAQMKKEKDDALEQDHSNKKIILFSVIGVFLITLFLRVFLYRRMHKKARYKYQQIFTYYDILSAVFLFSFLVWFFFYVRPDMLVLLTVIAGGLIVAHQDFLQSFASSLLIIQQYRVGDILKFNDHKAGIIRGMSPLYVTIELLGTNAELTGHELKMPNKTFIKEEVIKLPSINEMEIGEMTIMVRAEDLHLVNASEMKQNIEQIVEENKPVAISFRSGEQSVVVMNYSFKDGDMLFDVKWKAGMAKNIKIKKQLSFWFQSYISQRKSLQN